MTIDAARIAAAIVAQDQMWMTQKAGAVSYYVIGEDPGAQLLSTVYPEQGLLITVMGNTDKPIWPLYNEIESIAEAI